MIRLINLAMRQFRFAPATYKLAWLAAIPVLNLIP
jgi:hypothetical protein